MKVHEIETEIADRLSVVAHQYWAGMGGDLRNEMIVIAQREGIDAAIQTVEELAPFHDEDEDED